jgi:membrane-associated protein
VIELAASFDSQLSSLAPFIFYVIVGAIVFVETGLFFGFWLPGDSILFSAGLVAASHGNINIALLVAIIVAAAFFGDQVGFVIGRVVGRPYLEKRESPRIQRMIARSERFYEHTGWWAVVAARFFPWFRTFVPPIAGASKMNYYKFLSANIFGAILWGAGITLAGYYAASVPWIKTSSYAIAAFFITASIVSATVNYLRHRREPQSKS